MASRHGNAPEESRRERSPERRFEDKADWHRQQARLSPEEKVAILLRLQVEVLPILRARRRLEPWERPWEIRP